MRASVERVRPVRRGASTQAYSPAGPGEPDAAWPTSIDRPVGHGPRASVGAELGAANNATPVNALLRTRRGSARHVPPARCPPSAPPPAPAGLEPCPSSRTQEARRCPTTRRAARNAVFPPRLHPARRTVGGLDRMALDGRTGAPVGRTSPGRGSTVVRIDWGVHQVAAPRSAAPPSASEIPASWIFVA